MDKHAMLSAYRDQTEGTVRLGEMTIEGQFCRPTEDKLLEKNLVFDVGDDVPLTKREEEILRLIVSGQTNKQIARRLSRSERTIEYHRNRLMHKVGAHNAAQLVKGAMVMGLV